MNLSVLLTDRDECDETNGVLHNCHEDAICENTVGSFRCQCNVGYRTTQDYDQGTECEGTVKFTKCLMSHNIDCKTNNQLVCNYKRVHSVPLSYNRYRRMYRKQT